MVNYREVSPGALGGQEECPRGSSLSLHMCTRGPHSGTLYLCKLPWAELRGLPAWAPHRSSGAAPASVQSADAGPSADATEVGLPIGLVTWKSPQWHHCVLAGGGQEGTPRKTQICCMFWKNRRQRPA